MMRLSWLFVIASILCFGSAAAQDAPCSAGLQDPPIFRLVDGSQLTFSDTVHAVLSAPVVTIAGQQITVVQTDYPTLRYPDASCNRQSVNLGNLAAGSYSLTWTYQSLSNTPLKSYVFSFTIPPPSPCVVDLRIQASVPERLVSIAYTVPYRGFLQTPDVVIDGNQVIIDQPSVIADPLPGQIPCATGVVQIGSLLPGHYLATVRGSSLATLSGSFDVGPAPVTRRRAARGH